MLDRGIDPRSAWVKQQAQMKFLARKNAQQRGVQGPPSMDRGALSRQGRPPSQPPMRAQGSQPGPPPGSHQQGPFSDQFLGQQQDALRSQEAGQVVVPASNGQGAASHVRGTPHPQAQSGGGRIMQPLHTLPQQPPGFWNNPLNQQQGLAQTPQPDLPPQTPNLAHNGQTPQQQALQGQIGGLGNNRGQGTPQQSHTMPTLNRPLEPPGQATNGMSQNSVQQGAKGVTRNGLSGQDVAGQTIPGQQRPQGPTKTDVATYMRGLPSPKRKYFVAEMQKRQRQLLAERAAGAGNAQAATQPGSQGAPVVTAGGQPGRVQAGPVGNLNAPQAPMNPVNGMNGQPQPVPNGSAPAQQRYTPIPMDINTTRMMDTQEYPPNLLNNNSNFVNMPQNIKHWGQLKQWVQQNAGILPPQTMERVTALQSIIFQQKRDHAARMQQQGNARPQPGGVAPPAQMVPNQDNQPASQATPTPKPFRMPSLPPPTPQEMQAARAQLVPHMKGASDDQLRTMIMSKRQQEYLRAVQGQAGLTHQQQMQSHNMLRFQQAEAQRRQTVIGMNQHGQAQPPQRGPNQPPQAGQQWTQQPVPKQAPQTNGAQAKRQANRPGPQATVNQRAAKRNNNNDDVIEVPDPKIAQQLARPPVATNVPVPVNALPQIMAEKWSSMTDEQKARFSEQRRLRTAQAQQNGQTVQGQIPVEASGNAGQMAGRDSRLRELTLEVSRNMPPFPPIPMTPNTRARMVEKLKDASGMATRLEQSLPLFLSLSKNENKTKELLRAVCILYQSWILG